MSGLENIGVRIIDATGLSGNAMAILHEISGMLDTLLAQNESGIIDLQSLPLTPADYELLRQSLAEGEVYARIDAIGPTEVRETIYPGVWWQTHYNVEGDIVADLIEVTMLPDILKSHPDDVREGQVQLKSFLSTVS